MVLAFAATILLAGRDSHAGWVTIQPKNAGFKVDMPHIPFSSKTIVKEEGYSYPCYKFATVDAGIEYQVTYAEFPIKVSQDQVDQLLENMINGISKVSKSEIVNDDKSNVEGKPARVFLMQNAKDELRIGMVCYDGHRGYICGVDGPRNVVNGGTIRDFGKTFKFVPYK